MTINNVDLCRYCLKTKNDHNEAADDTCPSNAGTTYSRVKMVRLQALTIKYMDKTVTKTTEDRMTLNSFVETRFDTVNMETVSGTSSWRTVVWFKQWARTSWTLRVGVPLSEFLDKT